MFKLILSLIKHSKRLSHSGDVIMLIEKLMTFSSTYQILQATINIFDLMYIILNTLFI
jgi:hypothetical protein